MNFAQRVLSLSLIAKVLLVLPSVLVIYRSVSKAVDVSTVDQLRPEITNINNGQADNVIDLTEEMYEVEDADNGVNGLDVTCVVTKVLEG